MTRLDFGQTKAQPLTGITVVELGTSVAGPFATQVLGDLGARVIKVERPKTGDDARAWGPPFWHGSSATFQSLNRNKLSAVVDLTVERERECLRRFIVEEADVVLQSLRPGLVERFGLCSRLTEAAPRLIYCNLGAFGAGGPLSDRAGYDPLMQAFAGLMNITGEPGREPVRIGPSIVDIGTGMWCVIGILAALYERSLTGKGTIIDTSLFETALAWMTVPAAMAKAGMEPIRTGSEAAMIAPYKAYRARDGEYLIIAAGNDKLFSLLCGEIGRPEWIADPRFRTNADRVTNREVLNELIAAIVQEADLQEWTERFEKAGVPHAPLQSISRVLEHPHTVALGMLAAVPDSPMELMALPLRFKGTRPEFRSAPPELGNATELILKKEYQA